MGLLLGRGKQHLDHAVGARVNPITLEKENKAPYEKENKL